MRSLPAAVVLALALAGAGCAKKSSKEFHKLAADQDILVSRDGDDAWASAEMEAIVVGLQAVPPDAIERPRADELLAKIAAEKARVLAEREANKPPPAPAPVEFPTAPSVPTPAAEEEQVDAGPAPDDAGRILLEPEQGMSEAEFTRLFGSCFSKGPANTLSSGAAATSVQQLNGTPDCQKRFGTGVANGQVLFLFGPKGLAEKATIVVSVDSGTTVVPGKQPPAPDPGPPVLTIQGMPAQPVVGPDGGLIPQY